jgi:serine/threonine protein kinase
MPAAAVVVDLRCRSRRRRVPLRIVVVAVGAAPLDRVVAVAVAIHALRELRVGDRGAAGQQGPCQREGHGGYYPPPRTPRKPGTAVFLKVGDIVDRYVVEDLVAEGELRRSTACATPQLGSLHALKVLRVVFESLRQRTVIEGRIQARVRHPNLVPVTDIISIHDVPGLVMDFVDGPTLEDWLTSGERALDQLDADRRGGFLEASRSPTSPVSCTAISSRRT